MITREEKPWGIRLSMEPVPDMRMWAEIRRGRRNLDYKIRFDGTPPDSFLRLSDLATWMNALQRLNDEIREVAAEIRSK